MLLKNQASISPLRGMPTDTNKVSKTVKSVSGETVQLYYFNAGTLTSDAGQATGTMVVGKFANGPILDLIGAQIGVKGNSSLSFTSTALTTEKTVDFTSFEGMDYDDLETKLKKVATPLVDGEYVVDYVNGVIYGKKDSTTTTLTSTAYKISTISTTAVA